MKLLHSLNRTLTSIDIRWHHIFIHLCKVSMLFSAILSHTSNSGSMIPKPCRPENQSQHTKATRKHFIRLTKTPFSPLTSPENPAIIAYAGFLSWRDGRVVEGAGLESRRWANKPSKYEASADAWHQLFVLWRTILMAKKLPSDSR